MKIIKTHTGKIYVDDERKLEFLTVGDYGKEPVSVWGDDYCSRGKRKHTRTPQNDEVRE